MTTQKELTPFPMRPTCACKSAQDKQHTLVSDAPLPSREAVRSWNIRYGLALTLVIGLWCFLYVSIIPASQWLTYTLLGVAKDAHMGNAVEFFFYDTAKIFLLLILMVYAVAWIRAALNVEQVREFLAGKRKSIGYLFGAGFGAVTPFCSCSSIPLFLGFSMARIPIGITMSFLITSPLINEVAIVLLWGLLGWKFTVVYVFIGLLAGILGGFFMDSIKAGRWLQPFLLDALDNVQDSRTTHQEKKRLTLRSRHNFAWSETAMIVKKVWLWVIIGVGLGAALHGYVPQEWFAEHLGAGEWWSVPIAVAVGIPLYSNVTGIIPIMESLLLKGLPVGTTLAFCMSTIVASLPEVLMLKQVMQWRLLAAFLGFALAIFTLIGWLLNALGPAILL